jgi:hypothetical protein
VTVQDEVTADRPGEAATIDPAVAAYDLVAGLEREPWGQVGPSVYETARLVSLAPWLTGHAERVRYLVDQQQLDGGWGPPEGYGLVPTLSATEALLTMLRRGDVGTLSSNSGVTLAGAVDRGLRTLFTRLQTPALSIPDTPAADLIVPALIAMINEHLDCASDTPIRGLAAWWGDHRLRLPPSMDAVRLAAVRQRLTAGARLPAKVRHFLEVLGDGARRAPGIDPVAPGAVGGSPAATAAWLGHPGTGGSLESATKFLDAVVRRQGGPVPCPTPITVFERAWVLSTLSRAGVPLAGPSLLIDSLSAAVGPEGAATGAGLPADADTTSVTLYALAKLGAPITPDSLWAYETETGFCTWPGEDGWSVTTNAHVLDAFGQHLTTHPGGATRYLTAVDTLSTALADHQDDGGSWRDRWHASPYYATASCALALHQFGRGPAVAQAVAKAVGWIIATQRPDGSWGRWSGTAEETAYAMHVLLATWHPAQRRIGEAVGRGYAFLRNAVGQQAGPPLWYGKELYLPEAIVRSAVLAALHLAHRWPA